MSEVVEVSVHIAAQRERVFDDVVYPTQYVPCMGSDATIQPLCGSDSRGTRRGGGARRGVPSRPVGWLRGGAELVVLVGDRGGGVGAKVPRQAGRADQLEHIR